MAVLKGLGKEPSWSDRLIRVVMGTIKTSRQDFRRKVGIESSGQVAFEESRMALRISS